MMRFAFLFVLLFAACGRQIKSNSNNRLFAAGQATGKIDTNIAEASGLVESISNPGCLWTHNDSGNPPEVFLIDRNGKTRMRCKLPVRNRDWEDIAIGTEPDSGKNYIYLGDIGDNFGRYDTKFIYRFEEPLADEDEKTISGVEKITVRLSDGERDTETLMVDPKSNDLFLISKREDSVHLYRLKYAEFLENDNDTLIAERIAVLPFYKIVAGDISPDGSEMLLKDYEHIYYWKRTNNEPIEKLFEQTPEELPYDPEAQGEAIAWARDGSGFYTLSESTERKRASVLFYERNR